MPALQAVLHFQCASSGSTTKIPVGSVHVDGVQNFPTCFLTYTITDWDTGYNLQLMRQSGSQVINTGDGTKNLVVGAASYYKYKYPIVPNLAMSVANIASTWDAAFLNTGVSAAPYNAVTPVATLRLNYVTPAIQSGANKLPTNKDITIGWEVSI